MSTQDPLNLVLLAVAAIVLWRLWSVLGTRTGLEKPPLVTSRNPPETTRQPENTDVLNGEILPPENSRPVWLGYAAEGSPLAQSLEEIAARNKEFDVKSFLRGAGIAYEMVQEAFSAGNKQALKNLLSKELLDSFGREIDARNAKKHTRQFQFVGIKQAILKQAVLTGNKAQLDVFFKAEAISHTHDATGVLIEGDDKSIETMEDLWTFERDVTARDPNWKIVSTDGDV